MKAKHLRELRRITESIPKELIESLMIKEDLSPTLKEILERALLEPDTVVIPEQKNRFKLLLDSGLVTRQVEAIDSSVEKIIDEYLTAEIDLAVKLGRLPKKAPKMKLLNNKGKQYARRQAKRLEDLQGDASDSQDSIRSDNQENTGTDSTLGTDDGVLPRNGGQRAGKGKIGKAPSTKGSTRSRTKAKSRTDRMGE